MADKDHAPLGSIHDPGEIGRANHNRGDRAIIAFANQAAWLFPLLVLAICCQVVLRTSGVNQAWLDDLQWWLYGASTLVGIGYAVATDSHVRIDIFHNNFTDRRKQILEVFALTWLLLPFIVLSWDLTLQYAISSVIADEGSDSPNGLHNLWIMKLFVNFSFVFIAAAIWASYVRHLARLTSPTLFKQLLFAFPSTLFILDLAVNYVILAILKLTHVDPETGEALSTRQLKKMPIFDSIALGAEEIKITLLITLLVTFVVLAASWLWSLRNRS